MSKIIVWTKNYCPYCVAAKDMLNQRKMAYEERRIDDPAGNWTKEDLLKAIPEARTVPQIVIDDVVIGGFDRLKEYFSK